MKIFFGFTPSNMEIDDSINNRGKRSKPESFIILREDENKIKDEEKKKQKIKAQL